MMLKSSRNTTHASSTPLQTNTGATTHPTSHELNLAKMPYRESYACKATFLALAFVFEAEYVTKDSNNCKRAFHRRHSARLLDELAVCNPHFAVLMRCKRVVGGEA